MSEKQKTAKEVVYRDTCLLYIDDQFICSTSVDDKISPANLIACGFEFHLFSVNDMHVVGCPERYHTGYPIVENFNDLTESMTEIKGPDWLNVKQVSVSTINCKGGSVNICTKCITDYGYQKCEGKESQPEADSEGTKGKVRTILHVTVSNRVQYGPGVKADVPPCPLVIMEWPGPGDPPPRESKPNEYAK